jgi:hypothetical protein
MNKRDDGWGLTYDRATCPHNWQAPEWAVYWGFVSQVALKAMRPVSLLSILSQLSAEPE